MNETAKKLFHDHKNPVVKLDLSGSKLFFKASTSEDLNKIEDNRYSLENALKHLRVERRCARSKGEWCPDIQMAKMSKVVKGLLENYGFQDKNGIFLYPEEMLFLMENNRVEICHQNMSLTMQEGYNIVLNSDNVDFGKYMIYKKLVSSGYRVVLFKEILRKTSKNKPSNDANSEVKNKKRKLKESGISAGEVKKTALESRAALIDDIFKKMQSKAPKNYQSNHLQINPEYCVFFSNNKSRTNWDISVFICAENIPPVGYSDKLSVYGVCVNDNVSFVTTSEVNLPSLC